MMATITYKCNTCDRQVDLLENPIGLTSFSKCVITAGCNGKLNTIHRNADNIREQYPSESPGLEDYTQRKALFSYKQSIVSNSWNIAHNMGVSPVVTVFVNDTSNKLTRLDVTQYTIVVLDSNNIQILFNTGYTGEAQLLSRSSIKQVSYNNTTSSSQFQITSNGYFVFAVPKLLTKFTYTPTILPAPTLPDDLSTAQIRLEVSIKKPNQVEEVCTEYLSSSLVNTPWNGWDEILVRRRRNYYIFSKNILSFRTFGGDNLKFTDIPDGTQLRISRIDYGTGVLQPIQSEGLLMLLSNSPYTSNDKIKNKIIDVGDMIDNSIDYFSYFTSDFFIDATIPEKTYPDILRVK